MKFSIKRQASYSRGELLLRTLFGVFYIGIPHGFCLLFLALGSMFVQMIAFWAILITGKFPRGMFDFQVNVIRWGMRVSARFMNLTDGYPAFGLSATDPNIVLEIPYPESSSRGSVLLRAMFGFIYVMIPHGFCLYFMTLASSIVNSIMFWVILITGEYPKGMFDFVVGVQRWGLRVRAFMLYLTDTYPPFSMEETDPVVFAETADPFAGR